MTALNELQERIAVRQKIVEAATSLARQAAEIKAPDARSEYLVGLAFYELEEYEPAERHLAASFEFNRQAETAARLALCAWRVNDLPAARQWITRAISMDPKGRIETVIAQTRPSYVGILAQIQLTAGEIAGAETNARAAVALDGKDTAALHVLATAQLIKGDAAEAQKTFDRAIASAPPFVAEKLTAEKKLASGLASANVDFSPFARDLSIVDRVVV
jgi:ATP-dependent transcriptional regulator